MPSSSPRASPNGNSARSRGSRCRPRRHLAGGDEAEERERRRDHERQQRRRAHVARHGADQRPTAPNASPPTTSPVTTGQRVPRQRHSRDHRQLKQRHDPPPTIARTTPPIRPQRDPGAHRAAERVLLTPMASIPAPSRIPTNISVTAGATAMPKSVSDATPTPPRSCARAALFDRRQRQAREVEAGDTALGERQHLVDLAPHLGVLRLGLGPLEHLCAVSTPGTSATAAPPTPCRR